MLVLTGVSTLSDVQAEQRLTNEQEKNMKIPDFYIDSITEFYNSIK